jgi:hypothetical protein
MHSPTINARIDVPITYAMNINQLSIYGLKCARRRFVYAVLHAYLYSDGTVANIEFPGKPGKITTLPRQ